MTAIRVGVIGARSAVGFLLMACGQDGPSSEDVRAEWGPLSVSRGGPSGAEALAEGTLEVSDRCVTLTGHGDPVLLVWPEEGTSWKNDTSTIEYDDGDQFVELSEGDRFAVGGGGGTLTENGMSVTNWVGHGWVAEPHESCPSDTWFFVGGLPLGVGQVD